MTSRADVREVLPIPEQVTRVPGAKPWLRGIANLRGQLLTVVDLKSFLGAGAPAADRQARVLVVASREVPTGLIVDEVIGFRRFSSADYRNETSPAVIRCEHYLEGSYRRGAEAWPLFSAVRDAGDAGQNSCARHAVHPPSVRIAHPGGNAPRPAAAFALHRSMYPGSAPASRSHRRGTGALACAEARQRPNPRSGFGLTPTTDTMPTCTTTRSDSDERR